jgi:hypothetical protein
VNLTKEISHNQLYLFLYLEISSDRFGVVGHHLALLKKHEYQNSTVQKGKIFLFHNGVKIVQPCICIA